MDWRDIPSLSALRAFEAAARLESFSGAARALNVTHAAIAQHVRALEDELVSDLISFFEFAGDADPDGLRLETDLEKVIDDPHLNAGGLMEVTLADGRTAKLPTLPVAFGNARPGLRHDLPQPGADTDGVLAELLPVHRTATA